MKKFLTVVAAGILIIIAVANLGHIVGFAIGLTLTYWSVVSILRSRTLLRKFMWGIVGLVGLSIVLGNVPAIIGIGAIALLYYGYRQWKRSTKEEQPFHSFDEEWDKIMKKG